MRLALEAEEPIHPRIMCDCHTTHRFILSNHNRITNLTPVNVRCLLLSCSGVNEESEANPSPLI